MALTVGLDFGISNLKGVAWDGPFAVAKLRTWQAPTPVRERSERASSVGQLFSALSLGGVLVDQVCSLAVSGGRHDELPDQLGAIVVRKFPETQVLARGALALAGLAPETDAVVVSAGSGTAIVRTRAGEALHVGGTSMGGGTLLGLANLILGTRDPVEVSALAAAGSSANTDVTIAEAIGRPIGLLPPDATAVHFGKLARGHHAPSRADLAAGLVTMVSQVIAAVATQVALRERIERVLYVGQTVAFPGVTAIFARVHRVYGLPPPIVPPHAAFATVLGAALSIG